jgi:hypothetical protein
MDGVVVETEYRTDFLEEFWWLTSHGVRHISTPSPCPEHGDNGHRAKLPENSSNITLSGQNDKIINGWAVHAGV